MNWYADLHRPCPVAEGTRIELIRMNDPYSPVRPGTQGTVTGGNGAQVYVNWDDGRTLMLIPGDDRWRVIQ